ncbi:hypothetical protein EST38_g6292 [Candolleomyces aberdarensis]|uniref:Uncharacterized protein n=1 Tax=Candolleomyces aberdarensis TaxID=2316362 RepID=A0A4Q2DK47_9AGAR|nr:hypothetical protein EST38_g6292 [Candolleomyces aberdarensis]
MVPAGPATVLGFKRPLRSFSLAVSQLSPTYIEEIMEEFAQAHGDARSSSPASSCSSSETVDLMKTVDCRGSDSSYWDKTHYDTEEEDEDDAETQTLFDDPIPAMYHELVRGRNFDSLVEKSLDVASSRSRRARSTKKSTKPSTWKLLLERLQGKAMKGMTKV